MASVKFTDTLRYRIKRWLGTKKYMCDGRFAIHTTRDLCSDARTTLRGVVLRVVWVGVTLRKRNRLTHTGLC